MDLLITWCCWALAGAGGGTAPGDTVPMSLPVPPRNGVISWTVKRSTKSRAALTHGLTTSQHPT